MKTQLEDELTFFYLKRLYYNNYFQPNQNEHKTIPFLNKDKWDTESLSVILTEEAVEVVFNDKGFKDLDVSTVIYLTEESVENVKEIINKLEGDYPDNYKLTVIPALKALFKNILIKLTDYKGVLAKNNPQKEEANIHQENIEI